jgi:sporulation protein YlmC with PRC-barrel domain
MRSTLTTGALEPLSQSNVEIADRREDIRGRKVHDRTGEEFGKIEDVFVDPAERRARFVSVKSGDFLGLGGSHYLLPVEVISLESDRVVVNETADRIAKGPQMAGNDLYRTSSEADTTSWGDQTGGIDAAPIVLQSYDFYAIDKPFWSQGYQRPNWQ